MQVFYIQFKFIQYEQDKNLFDISEKKQNTSCSFTVLKRRDFDEEEFRNTLPNRYPTMNIHTHLCHFSHC